MSNVVKYETATGFVKEYLLSVNDPDYESPIPPHSFLISPDVSALSSVPVKYWKVVDGLVVEMSTAEKQALDDAADLARPPLIYPAFEFNGLNTQQCTNDDWPVNHAVPVIDDPSNQSIKCLQFDNSIASGIGFNLVFPDGKTCAVVQVMYRCSSSPATADKTLTFQARFRVIPDGAAINSWGQKALDSIVLAQDTFYHKQQWIRNLASGNLDGKLIQVQLVRRGDTDTYPAPVYVNKIYFKFS